MISSDSSVGPVGHRSLQTRGFKSHRYHHVRVTVLPRIRLGHDKDPAGYTGTVNGLGVLFFYDSLSPKIADVM